jgi:hypothetical protein
MRRASTCLAVLSIAVLGLVSVASATPTVKFKAVAIPIKGYGHTGNILGAGAALSAEFSIAGTEYGGGHPWPLIGVTTYLPTGSKINSKGFATCPVATIEIEKAPEKCPAASRANPEQTQTTSKGRVLGAVSLGGTDVPEESELFAFYKPGGGLEFFTFGHSPTILEIPSIGNYENLGGGGGFGPKFKGKVPLVETVPGAPFASVEHILIKVGGARGPKGSKRLKGDVYYGEVPKKCPKGGFPLKAELTFAEDGEESKPVVVKANYSAPCPKGK